MTPEEINKINQEIAEWVGLMSYQSCRNVWCALDNPCSFNCSEYEPINYYGSNTAFGLLDVLVERGYWYQLNGVLNNYSCEIGIEPGVEIFRSLVQPTKSAAICKACLDVIRRKHETIHAFMWYGNDLVLR